MNKQREIAILYSGGTDSTCTASIMADDFEIIHLLTFSRFGFFSVENSQRNVKALKEKFTPTRFIHNIINVEHLAKFISYDRFLKYICKYGFFILSNCVICSLIHHFRALIYCLDKKITNVADGSTRELPFFPSHMEKVISIFKEMYAKFGITYYTPVYNFDLPPSLELIDKIHALGRHNSSDNVNGLCKRTTGSHLFKIGILDSPNLKGTNLDHKMQPRCFQFILHHIFLYWYFMARYDYSVFEATTLDFMKDKIKNLIEMMEKNPRKLRKIISGN